MKTKWVEITETTQLPLEVMILVKHKFGIDALIFWKARWRYCYSAGEVGDTFWQNATHWLNPEDL